MFQCPFLSRVSRNEEWKVPDPVPEAAPSPGAELQSNKLKIRNSANNGFTDIGLVNEPNLGLLPKAGGTMTGQLKGDDASVAASPAYSFDQDPDTGMYRTAANKIGFATAGAERAIFDDFGPT